jgi:hypothetical protein
VRIDGSVALWQDLYRQPFKGITTDGIALKADSHRDEG